MKMATGIPGIATIEMIAQIGRCSALPSWLDATVSIEPELSYEPQVLEQLQEAAQAKSDRKKTGAALGARYHAAKQCFAPYPPSIRIAGAPRGVGLCQKHMADNAGTT
jgi:hypothetical protein